MKLDLISAWNDSGGGYLTRLLDGALDTQVWPYELLLGNDDIKDGFDGWFKSCYRWPGFGDQTITINEAAEFFDKTQDPEIKSVLREELLQNMPTLLSNSTSENGGTTSFQKSLHYHQSEGRPPAGIYKPVRHAVWADGEQAGYWSLTSDNLRRGKDLERATTTQVPAHRWEPGQLLHGFFATP